MIKNLYNKLIRPYLGYRYAELNGVETKTVRTLDQTWRLSEYNDEFVEIIHNIVSELMSVCIAGEYWDSVI